MAARLNPAHDARTREKIQTSQLINALQAHVLEGKKMSVTQIKAAEILLRKTLPDLTHTEAEVSGGLEIHIRDDWAKASA